MVRTLPGRRALVRCCVCLVFALACSTGISHGKGRQRQKTDRYDPLFRQAAQALSRMNAVLEGFRGKTDALGQVTPEMRANFTREIQPLYRKLFGLEERIFQLWLTHPDADRIDDVMQFADNNSSLFFAWTGLSCGDEALASVADAYDKRASKWALWEYDPPDAIDLSGLGAAGTEQIALHLTNNVRNLKTYIRIRTAVGQQAVAFRRALDRYEQSRMSDAARLNSVQFKRKYGGFAAYRPVVKALVSIVQEGLAADRTAFDLWLDSGDPLTCALLTYSRTSTMRYLKEVDARKYGSDHTREVLYADVRELDEAMQALLNRATHPKNEDQDSSGLSGSDSSDESAMPD